MTEDHELTIKKSFNGVEYATVTCRQNETHGLDFVINKRETIALNDPPENRPPNLRKARLCVAYVCITLLVMLFVLMYFMLIIKPSLGSEQNIFTNTNGSSQHKHTEQANGTKLLNNVLIVRN